jgi:hypothetical protein
VGLSPGCRVAEHPLKQTVGMTVCLTENTVYFDRSSRPLLSFSLNRHSKKSALSLVLVLSTTGAVISYAREAGTSLVDRIYPYLVTSAYPESKVGPEPQLGNGIRATVVVDVDGMVRSLTPDDLQELGMPWERVRVRALENLDRLAKENTLGVHLFETGPGGQPFIVVDGHWDAAALILSPKFRSVAVRALGSDDLCVSIPHRDVMLVFPKGDRAFRDEMRLMIRRKEADTEKTLTWKLFELTEAGPTALSE